MGLTDDLRHHFARAAIRKGDDYARAGRVSNFLETDYGAMAVVEGTMRYVVELVVDGEDAPGWCSCPAAYSGPCKHMWAVAVVLERSRQAVVPRPARDWRADISRLRRLGSAVAPSAWDLVPRTDEEVHYRLRFSASSWSPEWTLAVARRQRRADGTWGKLRNFDPSRVHPADLPTGEDRAILSSLGILGGEEADRLGHWSARVEEAVLDDAAARRVLPLAGRTGRLEFQHPTGATIPLRWTGEGPFRVRVRRAIDETGETLVVDAVVERGETSRSSAEGVMLIAGGFVVVDGELAELESATSAGVLENFLRQGPLRLPREAESALATAMVSLPPDLVTPESLPESIGADAPDLPPPVPSLHVAMDEPGRSGQRLVVCEIEFDYGGERPVGCLEPAQVVELAESGALRRRDVEAEARALRDFVELGGVRPKWGGRDEPVHHVPAKRVPALVDGLLERGWVVTADGVRIRTASDFSVSVKSGIDWFDLEGGMRFGDQEVAVPELLLAHQRGERRVRLGDGSYGMLPEDWLERWSVLGLGEVTDEGTVRFRSTQGWLLDAMLADREVEIDEGFESYRERLARFQSLRPRKEPRGFRGELRPYQRDALGWMKFLQDLGLGGCLADDMGLGKTVQVLAMLEAWRTRRRTSDEPHRPSLVVAPRSLVFNWLDEAARFAPNLVTLDYTGSDRKRRWDDEIAGVDLVLTTYGTLRRDAPSLAEVEFDHVVLDEATAIKNANSQAAKAARLLRARHRLALTGTPVENDLADLWSLFEFLNPGMLGRSKLFRDWAGSRGRTNDVEALRGAIRPFFLRRTKEDVLTDLPPKTEQVLHVELSPKERRRYDELKRHFRAQLLDEDGGDDESLGGTNKIQVLEALLRLRQAACHPGLVDAAYEGESSAKLDELLERIGEVVHDGHKVLVFSQFTRLLALVRRRLDERDITYEYLDGRTRKRKERVERFQGDPDCPVFLISLKAGGHGLNLTASDYVFLLDPWWNPAVESQAVDRAHRMGQQRPVFAYRMIAKDTVEERVLELQQSKRELADALFGSGRGLMKSLTRSDLERLLT
ncbi:MAG: DEAD/DEAH box helicase [Planctomycetota bacterium]